MSGAQGVHITKIAPPTINAAIDAHLASFAGYMNARLGRAYVRAMLRWFAESPTAVAIVALDADEQGLGYAIGAPLGYGTELGRATLLPAALGVLSHPNLLLDPEIRSRALSGVRGLLPTPDRRGAANVDPQEQGVAQPTELAYSLVGIGVTPDAQSAGVGQALLREFERETKQMGASRLYLTVYRSNSRARGFYERQGWNVVASDQGDDSTMKYSKSITR